MPHQLGQPARLGLRHRRTERRDPVVAPPLVVLFRRGTLAGLDEQSLLEHALDRSVERAGAQLQLSAGARRDVLDDGVAVPVLVGQGQQDVERRGRQRQQRVDLRRVVERLRSSMGQL